MAQKLEEQEENALEIKENFTSLQQEVDIKTKKLKKVKIIKYILFCISSYIEVCYRFYLFETYTAQKLKFPLRISFVNVSKSAENCGCSNLLKNSQRETTILWRYCVCVKRITLSNCLCSSSFPSSRVSAHLFRDVGIINWYS